MPKVIAKDNFDRDYISDRLEKDGLSMHDAQDLAERLNRNSGDRGQWFYIAASDEVKLYQAHGD